MTRAQLLALSPFLVLTAGALVTVVSIGIHRSHRLATGIAVVTLLLALGSLSWSSSVAPCPIGSLLVIDDYAVSFGALLLGVSLVICILAHDYFAAFSGHEEEFAILLLFATVGALTLAASTHFASFFLGLELLSSSLYVLIAFLRSDEASLESGLKYVVLAALSSAFLLFGIALLYAQTGSLVWREVLASAPPGGRADPWLLAGAGLLVVAIGFKLALVPFHLWTPDVYQGSPAPATALVATLSKAAMFALLFRYFALSSTGSMGAMGAMGNGVVLPALGFALGVVAVLSIVVGNLLALLQDNVKRLLAYSSIAHFGYLMVALLAGGELALPAAGLYLTSYLVTMLGALGVVTLLSRPGDEAERIEQYQGLFWRSPGTAIVFAAMLLSLAGMPLTAGFVGKLYVVAAGVSASQWTLVLALVAGSVLGLYYYLRVLMALFQSSPEGPEGPEGPEALETLARPRRPARGGALVLAFLVLALVWIGLAPATVLPWFQRPVAPRASSGELIAVSGSR